MSVREELQAIYDKVGMLTPELVVTAARPKDHPLHASVFDREPTEAAEAWYRHRAHELIQSVRIVYREATDNEPARDIRAWHSIRRESGYVFEPVEHIASDPLSRKILLADMEREWKVMKQRYDHFQEFWKMVNRDAKAA